EPRDFGVEGSAPVAQGEQQPGRCVQHLPGAGRLLEARLESIVHVAGACPGTAVSSREVGEGDGAGMGSLLTSADTAQLASQPPLSRCHSSSSCAVKTRKSYFTGSVSWRPSND